MRKYNSDYHSNYYIINLFLLLSRGCGKFFCMIGWQGDKPDKNDKTIGFFYTRLFPAPIILKNAVRIDTIPLTKSSTSER